MKLFDLSVTSHPPLYHESRNSHKLICSPMWPCVPLVQTNPAPVITEEDFSLQMRIHLQCDRLLYAGTSWVKDPIIHSTYYRRCVKEDVSLACLFMERWYHHALLNFPPKEKYEFTYIGILTYLGLFCVCQNTWELESLSSTTLSGLS